EVDLSSARQPTSRTLIEWNTIALRTTAAAPLDPPRESRALAMTHGAIYDAVQSIAAEYRPYLGALPVAKTASPEAATVAAAHDVLARLYPAQRQRLDAAY